MSQPVVLLSSDYWSEKGAFDTRLVLVAWMRDLADPTSAKEFSVHYQTRPGSLFWGAYYPNSVVALRAFAEKIKTIPFEAYLGGLNFGHGVG